MVKDNTGMQSANFIAQIPNILKAKISKEKKNKEETPIKK